MALSGFNTPVARSEGPVIGQIFSKQKQIIEVSGILSDMDGTLIDSTNAIVKHWELIGKLYGIDPKTILATSHGRRSIDVFQTIDPANATWDYVCKLEAEVPLKFGGDAEVLPGVRQMLSDLDALNAKWAIVTSGTRGLVAGWLKVLNLDEPDNMVTAEDVKNGKPDPEGYQLGAKKLGLDRKDPNSILVLEDAPAGIRAGKAAGYKVLGLATTHSLQQIKEAGADWIVPDLSSLKVQGDANDESGLQVQISNLLA